MLAPRRVVPTTLDPLQNAELPHAPEHRRRDLGDQSGAGAGVGGGWLVSGERDRYPPKKKSARRPGCVEILNSGNIRLPSHNSANSRKIPAIFGQTANNISAKFGTVW